MFARFFIDRPVFATVLSLVVVILGGVALYRLPIAQYPDVTPPTIQVAANYPGASGKVVAESVATPLETEINGVENMLYMSSKSSNDGQMNLDIVFEVGTDLDTAQVLVQNRVAIAEAKLPEDVRRTGVVTKKRSPNILLVVNIISPDKSRDQLYLSNFATLQVKDALARIDGVGDVLIFGARDYSMRVWIDPDKLATRGLNAGDVVKSLREQNIQVAAGSIGQRPATSGQEFQIPINTLGRLIDEEEFGDVVVKTGVNGQVVRLRDVARVELGSRSYDSNSYLDGQPSVGIALFQRPGSNALATAKAVRAEMKKLKAANRFTDGTEYAIVYDTTAFVNESVKSVYHTLLEAFILVFLVVLLFLQDWKATILPMIDVPVSLIGTFAVMAALGFTLNNLTLFGLVLAIGIVVDDAIVVLENVERWMSRGMNARDATRKAMSEVTGPIIAITLVLSCVFIPTALITGISGQFYRQFALTIAASTLISAMNAMTMTPSRCAQIFASRDGHMHDPGLHEPLPWWGVAGMFGGLLAWLFGHQLEEYMGVATHYGDQKEIGALQAWTPTLILFAAGFVVGWIVSKPVIALLRTVFAAFNRGFDRFTNWYGNMVGLSLRYSPVMLMAYVVLMVLTYIGFQRVPGGFIPETDKAYVFVAVQLPDGASVERTEEVMKRVVEIGTNTPGVAHTISIPGFSFLTGANLSNSGVMFLTLKSFDERAHDPNQSAPAILQNLRGQLFQIEDAMALAFPPPAVDGIGTTGGFKLQVQDRGDRGPEALQNAVDTLRDTGVQQPGLVGLFSTYRASQPQIYLEVDRAKAKAAGVALSDVFETLQAAMGSAYVNDFTRLGRNWQVMVQADAKFRDSPRDISRLKVRGAQGQMVPIGTLVEIRDVSGPSVVSHYNMFPSAELAGSMLPGTSSGQAIALMDQVAIKELPNQMTHEWTELSLQEIRAENTAVFVFVLGTVFVYLVLAAQYESWSLPTAIVLIVPMCLFAAISGIWLTGRDNNIFTQIGLVVLVGLASKNAILIVEFARQLQLSGKSRFDATVEACKLRLRPILMTSFAFILGVVPLVRATGAGYEMRRALGVAVFSGMLGVTFFGLFFTPVFYVVIDWLGEKLTKKTDTPPPHPLTESEPEPVAVT